MFSLNKVYSSVSNPLRSGECPTPVVPPLTSWHLSEHTSFCATRAEPEIYRQCRSDGVVNCPCRCPVNLPTEVGAAEGPMCSLTRGATIVWEDAAAVATSPTEQRSRTPGRVSTRPTQSTGGAFTLPTWRRIANGQQTSTAPGILASIVDSTVKQIDCEVQTVAVNDKELC